MQPQNLSQTKCNSKLHCCIYFENLHLKIKQKNFQNPLTFEFACVIISKHKCEGYGELAQLARASGSYPAGRWFKSDIRYHQNATSVIRFRCVLLYGALVKRLRHGPFTAVTGVRFPLASPKKDRHPNVGAYPFLMSPSVEPNPLRRSRGVRITASSLPCRKP